MQKLDYVYYHDDQPVPKERNKKGRKGYINDINEKGRLKEREWYLGRVIFREVEDTTAIR